MEQKETSITISPAIIWQTAAVILTLWFVYAVREALILFLSAVLITALLEPAVDALQRRRVRRSVAVLFIFLAFFVLIGIALSLLIPQIISESKYFSQTLPDILEKISGIIGDYAQTFKLDFDRQAFLKNIGLNFSASGAAIFNTTMDVFSGFVSLIVVLSLAFYMSVREDAIKNFFILITPSKYHGYVASVVERVKGKIGKWMQGQLLLMFVIFLLYFIALSFIGVPYALVLALIGGLLEIIPYVGPIVAAVPAVVVGLMESPVKGFVVLAAYIVIHQTESHVVIPQVMKKAVGISPVAIILSLLVGAELGGVVGAILAVPVATAVSVIVGDYFGKIGIRKEEKPAL